MVDERLLDEMRDLGYEVGFAFEMREDSADEESPVVKQVWHVDAETVKTYVGSDEEAQALIDGGRPPTQEELVAQEEERIAELMEGVAADGNDA